jgi:predicted P-type ATPase
MRKGKGYSKMKAPEKKKGTGVGISDEIPLVHRSVMSSDDSKHALIPIISWVTYSSCGYFTYLLLCILTCGVFFILSSLFPAVKEWFVCSSCHPSDADSVVILHHNQQKKISVTHFHLNEPSISLEIECHRYWTSASVHWALQSVPDVPDHFSNHLRVIPDQNLILSHEELELFYGLNKMELPQASFIEILSKTMVHPFYLFQYFAVVLWMAQDYVLYSLVILLITGGAVYLTTSETIYNLDRLHHLAGQVNKIGRINNQTGAVQEVEDTELVPGDHIVLRANTSLPCDCVLLSGRVSVDESMLTGESVPVNKSPVDHTVFLNSDLPESGQRDSLILSKQSGSILFSGTKILVTVAPTRSKQSSTTLSLSSSSSQESYARSHCVGVVYRTSFRSAKGQLISTLLNPNENFMSFFSDALYVILFMAIMCTALYVWSAVYLVGHGASTSLVALKYLDALTIAVPPGLTASLTVATGIAINRLKDKGIYVSESTRVNWAGIITAACFDKTGTLTEERLHFKGVSIPKTAEIFGDREPPPTDAPIPNDGYVELSRHDSRGEIIVNHFPSPMTELMATCHALSLINGSPCGDPLEVELFRASGFFLTSSPHSSSSPLSSPLDHSLSSSIVGSRHDHSSIRTVFGSSSTSSRSSTPLSSAPKFQILKHFEFSSEKLRSGSLVLRPNKDLVYFCKGSPEKILELVTSSSVPLGTAEILTQLSKRGYRVIACCFKRVATGVAKDSEVIHRFQTIPQTELERDCQLLGFVFLSNALKKDTVMTIKTLTEANISCTMITGDHVHTAIAIGTDCQFYSEGVDVNIIDEDENSATGLVVTSMLTGRVVSYNLSDFLFALRNLKEHNGVSRTELSPLHLTVGAATGADCAPQSLQVALTGRGLEVIKRRYSDDLNLVLHLTQIYARMKPSDKQFIVQEMEKQRGSYSESALSPQSTRDYSERGEGVGLSIHSASSASSSFSSAPLQISISHAVPDSPPSALSDPDESSQCYAGFCGKPNTTHVVFCGDGMSSLSPHPLLLSSSFDLFPGANDMAALRSATVGVSLCEAETSVAAPITSRFQTPGSVVDVIKEGRCSLVTAYVLVTFNIMYATIQLLNAIMMYHYGLLVGNNTYLIQDLFFTLLLALAISVTPPADSLGKECPPHRFFTKYLFLKLFLQLVTFVAFQIFSLELLASQVWYVRYDCQGHPLRDTLAAETSVIASMGLCQLIIASIVSCIDLPFRQEWWRNGYHLLAIFGQLIFIGYQIFARESYFLTEVLEIQPLPYDFCTSLLSLIIIHCAVSGLLCCVVDVLKNRGVL